MPDSNEYPRVLYREGADQDCWGVQCDLLNVHSDEERDAALGDGWSLEPPLPNEAAEPAPLTILDEPVAKIIELLPAMTKEELEALKADEIKGKTRKSLLKAIDAILGAEEG